MNKPGAPFIIGDDGRPQTHLLAWGDADDKYFVYPLLQWKQGGRLVGWRKDGELVKDTDPSDALRSGNVMWFETKEEAVAYAAGSWKK